MTRLIGIIGRIGGLALLLAALSFALPDRAEAAPMDHGHHAVDHDHAAGHHAVTSDAAQHDCDGCDQSAPVENPSHMGHGCHCVSAACTPVVPPQGTAFVPCAALDSPPLPPSRDAEALASVAPPSEPPRA